MTCAIAGQLHVTNKDSLLLPANKQFNEILLEAIRATDSFKNNDG